MARRLFIAAFLLTALCACGGGNGDTEDEDAPDPQVLLTDAAKAAGQLQSFHFDLQQEKGNIDLPLRLQLVRAEGDVVVPDRLKAEVRAKSGSLNVDVEVVSVNDRTWITNPFSRQFQELPGTNLRDIIDPVALLDVMTSELTDVRVSGSQELDGVDTYHLTGAIDSSALGSVLPVESGRQVEVELWLGKEDDLPRRVRLKGALTSGSDDLIVRINFSRFDEKVEITAPR